MNPRLGVNIDHIATLRQARGEMYPSIKKAAHEVLKAGADQITIHLREDRRHIQDSDCQVVQDVIEEHGKLFNLEMGCNESIFNVAKTLKPQWICLVPEKREEKTTEGGLNLKDGTNVRKINDYINRLKDHIDGVKVSLFVEADSRHLEVLSQMSVDALEIHTGEYAIDFNHQKKLDDYLSLYSKHRKEVINELKIGYHAGHGLTFDSTKVLVDNKLFDEYNIGHWIVSESVFEGLGHVVSRLNNLIKGNL